MKRITFAQGYMSFLTIATSFSINTYMNKPSNIEYETRLKTRNL